MDIGKLMMAVGNAFEGSILDGTAIPAASLTIIHGYIYVLLSHMHPTASLPDDGQSGAGPISLRAPRLTTRLYKGEARTRQRGIKFL